MIIDSPAYKKCLRRVAQQKKILDVGGADPFQKDLAKYESWFAHAEYETMDLDPRSEPTFRGDIHDIPREDASYDGVICKQVLEHVHSPYLAVKELHRILKPGGRIFVSVPFIAPYHAKPGSYHDYYRFTIDGLKFLFEEHAKFSHVEIYPERGFFATMLVFIPWAWLRVLASPIKLLDKVFDKPYQSHGYILYAEK